MVCTVSCSISAIFIIAMIYFYNATARSDIVKHYKKSLPSDLQERYEKISRERMMIGYQGYALGFILSLFIIFYNLYFKSKKLNSLSLVCIVLATSFITNYFYYILYPKQDWMLDHINSKEQVQAWLQMYKEMQKNYHMGFVFGIIAIGILAFAFRC